MSKRKSVAIIGHFGGKEHFTDGQTIKTINLYIELTQASDWNIRIVDTYYKNKHPIYLLFKTAIEVIRTRNIILLVSKNGLRFYLPLLNCAAKILKTKVYHDVIGGNLSGYIKQHPRYVKYLNSFQVNFVETQMLCDELIAEGVKNTEILPNFRRSPILIETELKNDYKEPYDFCTFSSVLQEKGIEDAIQAIEEINKEAGKTTCSLDIYGPVKRDYQERFDAAMKKTTEAVRYCGEVPHAKSVETLKNYYAVLFPTYYLSESQAGTISESFAAGVPVIASDWRCNHEMIQSGYNGMLYPSDYVRTLKEGIEWLISQKNEIVKIKRNCLKSALYYQPDEHIKKLIKFIEAGI